MSLQGTLDTFAVADVIRLLANTTKTGELTVEGDRGTGRLWFADGSLIGGEPAADGKSVNATFNLLRFGEGRFLFEADAAPTSPSAAENTFDVLTEAEERLAVWREVEALVPSPDVTVRLRDQLEATEATVTREQWAQLVVVGGGTTARQFAEELDLEEVSAAVAIKALVDAGLAVVGDEPDGPGGDSVHAESDLDDRGAGPELSVVENLDAPAEPMAGPGAAADTVIRAEESADTLTEPRPTLRSLVRDVATGPVDRPVELPVEAVVAAEPEVVGPGSVDVALDTQLGGATDDHSYLASADDGTSLLPEPLLAEEAGEWAPDEQRPDTDAAPAAAAIPEAVPPTTGDESEDLTTQLDSLSPAAARAIAAAATDDSTEAGRSALRKIIGNGRG